MAWKTHTHSLLHAVNHEGRSYSTITLSEPDADALEAIDELGIEEGKRPSVRQLKGFIAAIADTPDIVGKLHRDDFIALQEIAIPLVSPPEEPGTA